MSNFTKRALAIAVAGVIAAPGLAAAATLSFPNGTQITYAKDLIVNNGITIQSPNDLTLRATTADTQYNAVNVAAGEVLTFKITLNKGAKFDSSANPNTAAANYQYGSQLAGATFVPGSAYYSASGDELIFQVTAGTASNAGTAAGDFVISMDDIKLTNLRSALFDSSSVDAEITVQEAAGSVVLASRTTIAKSLWGVTVERVAPVAPDQVIIDVAGCQSPEFDRRTNFAAGPGFGVGSACAAGGTGTTTRGFGGIAVSITEDDTVGPGINPTYVNNFAANGANPYYNIVNTGVVTVRVEGSNLSAFRSANGGNLFLSDSSTCSGGNTLNGTINTAGTQATFTVPVTNPLMSDLANVTPGTETVYVCGSVSGESELTPQDLKSTVFVAYNLPTQRVDPPQYGPYDLLSLVLNGSTLVFQNVNPGANAQAQSFLRLTNNNASICPVTIDAKDDAGRHSNPVTFTMGAHESWQFNSDQLENGGRPGATGSFGNGTGKWYVRVTAECSNFKASALNRNNSTGTVTNLTPEKFVGSEWLTPDAKL